MDEQKPGKRLAEGEGLSKGTKVAIGVVSGLVIALAAGYLGLCTYVGGSGTVLPNTTTHGVALGGLTQAEAADALTAKLSAQFHGTSVTFTYPKEGGQVPVTVPGELVGADTQAAAQAALNQGRESGFLANGFHLVRSMLSGQTVEVPLAFTDEAAVDAILDGVADDLDRPMTETTWAVEGENLVFHTGASGLTVDRTRGKADILAAFEAGTLSGPAFALEPVTEAPPALDLQAVHDQIAVAPADARLDMETKEIVPAVVGVSFDTGAVSGRLGSAPEGSDVSVPLTLTQPNMTTEKLTASLFKDVLGEATSRVGGSGNRKFNVKLSAEVCGENILLPGDVFSYNDTTGSRSASKGYLPAPAYVGGLSVDEVGGGICQTSSTIYYATLLANLKIVERHNHMYAVGYVPDGADATVYYGSLDFRFENDTEYPIKIVTESYDSKGSRYLTVKILGTKLDDTYVQYSNREVSSIAPQTVYKADASVPQGSAPRADPQSTAYRGRKVEGYRNIYSADGTLISSTLESVNQYKKRDKVLLVNPADLATYQAGGTPGASPPVTTPPVTTPPAVTDPGVTPPAITGPVITPGPVETPVVTPTPAPAVTPVPEATPAPPLPDIPATPTPDNGIPVLTPPPVEGGAANA